MTKALLALLVLSATAAAHPIERDRVPRPHPHLEPLVVPGERLPRPFVPTRYRARLVVGDKLEGTIAIDGVIMAPTHTIWLDFVGGIREAAAVRGASVVPLTVAVKGDRVALRTEYPLSPGAWSIELVYTAKIVDNGKVAVADDGATRDLIAEQLAQSRAEAAGVFRETVDDHAYTFTQSEPMDARKIFPCIDEPDLKVPWQLSLDIPAADLAASNAPIAKETPLPGDRKRVEFASTQPLPSYLVAFAVGPFDEIDAGYAKLSKTHLRILALHGHKAAWAAATSARVLDLLEAWTGIPYGYPKLDLVDVPRTGIHWAAMENPGLVTFADWVIRPDSSREQQRLWVAIAAHELAHQWFGDLVTMAWWNDIWLNESFAVWMAREIATQFDPAYAEPSDKAYADIVDVARPAAGETNYIQYFVGGRGARAISMFHELLGDEKFRAAIHAYLADHAHGNAVTADLGAALTKEYGAPLTDMLVGALDHDGQYEVTATRACPAIDIAAGGPTPVCIAYEQDHKRVETCAIAAKHVSIPVATCPRWVIPNANHAMRYLTHRTRAELIATSFDWAVLTTPERAALLDEIGPDVGLALRLVDAPDARAWAAETLAKASRIQPIDAFLRRHYLASAKIDASDRESQAALAAIAEVGDPALERAAAELVKTNLHAVRTEIISAVVRLALRADPALESKVFEELAFAFFERRRAILHALSASPSIVSRMASISQLTADDRFMMLADRCDPARRAEVQQAAKGLSDNANPILRELNACLDARDRTIELLRLAK